MPKNNGKEQEQLNMPLPEKEIKRLQEDLIGKILVVQRLEKEKKDMAAAYKKQIDPKKVDIEAIAETLRDQGGIDIDIEKMLKGIHQQIEAGEGPEDQPEA